MKKIVNYLFGHCDINLKLLNQTDYNHMIEDEKNYHQILEIFKIYFNHR
jgi:hypothetical protein